MKKWWRSEYLSIPNLLGYVRILLIPLYLILYFRAETELEYLAAALVIGISGLTDCLDGKIARRFHMITEFGKILDPVADKLTQGALVLSLAFRYPLMRHILQLFVVKEIYMAVMGAFMLKKGRRPDGAMWCGKVCTAVLYAAMFILILRPDIGIMNANILMLVCMVFMLYSLGSYLIFYGRICLSLSREARGITCRGKDMKADKSRSKKIRLITAVVLTILLYLVLGAVIPYRKQPAVSHEFAESLDLDDFYSESVSCDRAMVLKDNKAALDERIRLIANAKENIILSTFAFQSDESGKDMLAALLAAAEKGVDIKILADGFNSCLYMDFNPYFYALSSKDNVEIRIYNKVNLLTPWTSMGRMHDKYLIADDTAYILGGRNTFDYFLGNYEGNKNHDWDVLVYNTAGKGAPSSLYQVKEYFYDIWKLDVCSAFEDKWKPEERVSIRKAEEELKDRYETIKQARPELSDGYDYERATLPANKITLISNPTGIYPKEPQVFYVLTELMKNARETAYVHTPYVIFNDAMYQAFKEAAKELKEFKLLTNSAVNNSNPFASGDYLLNKGRLLETGVEILEYEGGISYHGKCIAIDDDMSVIGSFNMDMRSAYLDTELMLAIDSKELNAKLKKQMESYEDKAFKVIDEENYEEKEGITKQRMPFTRLIKLKLMRFAIGWARFLL